MTPALTEHAKTILRAIADEKEIEAHIDNEWVHLSPIDALVTLANSQITLRIKPETRSINGVEFGAPSKDGEYYLRLVGPSVTDSQYWRFTEAKDRDTAYQAIVDALVWEVK